MRKRQATEPPLSKGLACARCKFRKVRCTADFPACAACLRSAKFRGHDLSEVVCGYDGVGKCSEDLARPRRETSSTEGRAARANRPSLSASSTPSSSFSSSSGTSTFSTASTASTSTSTLPSPTSSTISLPPLFPTPSVLEPPPVSPTLTSQTVRSPPSSRSSSFSLPPIAARRSGMAMKIEMPQRYMGMVSPAISGASDPDVVMENEKESALDTDNDSSLMPPPPSLSTPFIHPTLPDVNQSRIPNYLALDFHNPLPSPALLKENQESNEILATLLFPATNSNLNTPAIQDYATSPLAFTRDDFFLPPYPSPSIQLATASVAPLSSYFRTPSGIQVSLVQTPAAYASKGFKGVMWDTPGLDKVNEAKQRGGYWQVP